MSGLLGVGSGFASGASDPAERARIQAGERATRDAARRSYLAAQPFPATITRVPCRGVTQHLDVARFLADSGLSARPDLVFGVYRVPDRISPRTPRRPTVTRFDAGEHRVRRAFGAPLLTSVHGITSLESSGHLISDKWQTTAEQLIDTVISLLPTAPA